MTKAWEGVLQGMASLVMIRPRRQVREMYLFLFLFSFAASLITVFEPVFFYKAGFPLWEIAMYYALHYTLYVLVLPLGGKFAARFGFERSLALSAPIFVVYFLVLASISSLPQLFWLAFVVLTAFKIFFWPAYHANFAYYTDRHNRGTEQSWVRLVYYGAGIIAPLLGGVIAEFWGFSALFIMAAGVAALAGLSLLRTTEVNGHDDLKYGDVWRMIRSRQHARMRWAMLGWGENLIHLVFWPIWLFIVLGSVELLGLVAAVSAAVAAVWGFFVGEVSDRLTARRALRLFTPLVALGYVFRMVAGTPLVAAATDVYSRTADVGVGIPFSVRLYKTGKRVGPLLYALSFETVLAIVKAALAWALVVLFLSVSASVGITVTFFIAGVLALFYAVL